MRTNTAISSPFSREAYHVKRFTPFVIILVLFVVRVAAGESTVAQYRLKFNNLLEKSDNECDEAFTKLLKIYKNALDQLATRAQKDGNLEALLVINREKERLKTENTGPSSGSGNLPPELASLFEKYHISERRILAENKARRMRLTTSYIAHLDRRIREFTKEGKIEEAIALRGEMKRAERIQSETGVSSGDLTTKPEAHFPASALSGFPSGLKDGLVLCHDFNTFRSDKVFDQSGHGHDGVVHAAEWLKDGRGKGNGVLVFQGEDSYVDLGDILNTLDYPVTISVWIKVDKSSKSSGMSSIFELDRRDPDDTVYSGFWLSTWSRKKFLFYLANGKGVTLFHEVKSAPKHNLKTDTWTHLTVIISGKGPVQFFINGEADVGVIEPAKMEEKVPHITHSSKPAVIGRNFPGLVDDLMIWNRVLTDQQVKKIYTMTLGK